jgi:predicted enzyme related to lactoylglutathione lyase
MDLIWLTGIWESDGSTSQKNQYEYWRLTDNKLTGIGFSIRGSDTTLIDKLTILEDDGEMYYVADVIENNTPVYYKIISIGDNHFISENYEHDFPKRIEYSLINDKLKAVISSEKKQIDLSFTPLNASVEYYALIYTKGNCWDNQLPPGQQTYMKEHSKHLADLRSMGKIAIGARYSDKGFIVLKVNNEQEAEFIINQDLAIQHSMFNAEIHPLNVFYYGSISNPEQPYKMKHAVQNFQIPVLDFEKGLSFYSAIMGYQLQSMEFGGAKLGLFNSDRVEGVGAAIIKNEGLKPSKKGTIIYLYVENNLESYLKRIEANEGSIVVKKTSLGQGKGYFAIFDDPQGNRVGLYSSE